MLVPSAGDWSGMWALMRRSSWLALRLDVGSGLSWGGTNLLLFTELGGVWAGFRSARSDYPPVRLAEAKRSFVDRHTMQRSRFVSTRHSVGITV